MPRPETKTEAGRVNKKLGESRFRSVEEILSGLGSESFGELINGIFEGAGGAKEIGKRIGRSSRFKSLKRAERMEMQKMIGNLALNHAKLNPSLGSDELAQLTDEQIHRMLQKEFGLVRLKEEANGSGSATEASEAG